MPGFVDVAWLSFVFLKIERRPNYGVDCNLTECFELTIVRYLNY